MSRVNFRETPLWADAKALVLEVYRLTDGWPPEARSLVKDIRFVARTLAKSIPNAFRKTDITGNVRLQMAIGHFAELEALLDIAAAMGFVEPAGIQKAIELSKPVETKLRELNSEAKKRANELMRKRTSLFGSSIDEDEEDD